MSDLRKGPALALIECKSIARGMTVTDAMVKKAPVTILESCPISPGKYLSLISGEVADVEEGWKAGIEMAGDLIVNHLLLPHVHSSILPAIAGTILHHPVLALGILETFSVASCVTAADIAAKMADVRFLKIRLAKGLGGKAYFVISGTQASVEVALDAAAAHVRREGLLTAVELIQNPHPDFITKGAFE